MSATRVPVTGSAAGVPYVALPPADRTNRSRVPLVVAWHLNDPPRSAAAMAAALPLDGLGAWRVYLDLPMHGRRQLPGGPEALMALGYEDVVLKVFEPQVSQAVDEFPAALDALRGQLEIGDDPIGVVGASTGALPAQLVIAGHGVRVAAAALISPVIQLAEVIAANEQRFGVTYGWTPESRAVANRFDLVARASEIAAADPQPAVLMITGADDDPAFVRQTDRLRAALAPRYRDPARVAVARIRDMGHAFAAEPGIEPAAQTPQARQLSELVGDWFGRHGV